MTARCPARWREPGPCGTPLVDGRCPNEGDHLDARQRSVLLDAVEASIARSVEANRHTVRALTPAMVADWLEQLARNGREFDPTMHRALVERAAEMIREGQG